MVSHYNVIANVIQQCTYESVGRKAKGVTSQSLLAPLPMSHIYALVVASHAAVWRGDGYVVLPKYDFRWFLEAIQRFRIEQILVVSKTIPRVIPRLTAKTNQVPPILLQILRSRDVCAEYDLSSVRFLFSGAAPLGEETIQELSQLYPRWTIAQAYGKRQWCRPQLLKLTIASRHDRDICLCIRPK